MKQEVLPHITRHPSGPHHVDAPSVYQAPDIHSVSVICSSCNAVLQNGMWQWQAAPIDSIISRCPACVRVHGKKPAGYLSLIGYFAHDHRNEMLSLIHHIERREKAAHPLKRIMWIEYQEDGVTVTTTDMDLTRDIGKALLRAYKGDLDYHLNDQDEILYVRWHR